MNRQGVKVLVVDDEDKFLASLSERMKLMGIEPMQANSGHMAIELAKKIQPDLAIVDLNLPDIDGLVTITKLKELYPNLRTILLTGYGNEKVKQATEALNTVYLEKDNMGDVWNLLRNFRNQSGMIIVTPPPATDQDKTASLENLSEIRPEHLEALAAKKTLEKKTAMPGQLIASFGNHTTEGMHLIGETPPMQELKKNITKVAALDCTVLIRGETGTGKELVARTIHIMSPRKDNRFLAVNCGSFSQELLCNELFGHEKEAFTGALRCKKGMLEAASGGTVLLDEIGDMPNQMQVQLLRVLEDKTILRVGGTEEIVVDIRVLAATNKSLREKVKDGSFREDLYYRLNVFEIRIPPLRERRDDIAPLCSYYLNKYRWEFNKDVESISQEVMSLFMEYSFPGNIRELVNIIERAVILCEGMTIETKHLPERFQKADSIRVKRQRDKLLSLAELESNYILEVLEATGGNKSRAAEILGISRPALWRKLKLIRKA